MMAEVKVDPAALRPREQEIELEECVNCRTLYNPMKTTRCPRCGTLTGNY